MAQSDAARLGLRELTEEEAAGKRRTKLEDYDPTPGTYQKRTVVSQVRDKHGNVIEDHLNPGLKPQDDTGYVQTTKFKGGGKYAQWIPTQGLASSLDDPLTAGLTWAGGTRANDAPGPARIGTKPQEFYPGRSVGLDVTSTLDPTTGQAIPSPAGQLRRQEKAHEQKQASNGRDGH